jgi:hypothetical protein
MPDLRGTRVVINIPPEGWFGGYDRVGPFSLSEQIERRFGVGLYQLDTKPWAKGSRFLQQKTIGDLRAFRPELAISLSNAGYALLCSVQVDGATANLFTERARHSADHAVGSRAGSILALIRRSSTTL